MIVSLQYLRGLAAMMVVAFHASEYLSRVTGAQPGFPFAAGVSGVDLFFVISGFVILRTTEGRSTPPLVFLWKRIVRVVPLYWLLTLVVANVAIVRPDLLTSSVYDGGHLLASLFFVPVRHPVIGETLPLLIPGWTLNYEMAFYLLFALSLFLPRKAQVPALLAVLAGAVALREFIPFRVVTAFYTMPLILEFGAGIVIAKAHGRGLPVRPALAAAAFLVGWAALLAMGGSGLWRSLASGAPAALIVAGAVFWERARGVPNVPILRRLGDASYSIYLTHVLAMPVFVKLWALAGIGTSLAADALFLGLAVLSSAAAGIVVHAAVERPLLLRMRGRAPGRAAAGAAGDAAAAGPMPAPRRG